MWDVFWSFYWLAQLRQLLLLVLVTQKQLLCKLFKSFFSVAAQQQQWPQLSTAAKPCNIPKLPSHPCWQHALKPKAVTVPLTRRWGKGFHGKGPPPKHPPHPPCPQRDKYDMLMWKLCLFLSNMQVWSHTGIYTWELVLPFFTPALVLSVALFKQIMRPSLSKLFLFTCLF